MPPEPHDAVVKSRGRRKKAMLLGGILMLAALIGGVAAAVTLVLLDSESSTVGSRAVQGAAAEHAPAPTSAPHFPRTPPARV